MTDLGNTAERIDAMDKEIRRVEIKISETILWCTDRYVQEGKDDALDQLNTWVNGLLDTSRFEIVEAIIKHAYENAENFDSRLLSHLMDLTQHHQDHLPSWKKLETRSHKLDTERKATETEE